MSKTSILDSMENEINVNVARCIVSCNKDELLGLFDFYSDRATAHASLSVAVVVGIFGLLTIYKSNVRSCIPIEQAYFEYLQAYWWFFLLFFTTYMALCLGAIYLALNFGWYTEIADKAKFLLLQDEGYIKAFATYRKNQFGTVDNFLNDMTQGYWLYKTSKNVVRRCVLSLRRAYIRVRLPKEAIYPPKEWEKLETMVKAKEISVRPVLIYLSLIILPMLIFAIKIISDWAT